MTKEYAPGTLQERAKVLQEAVNEASRQVGKVHLAFVLLGTYVGVIIASTTDEQLLRGSPVALPILDVKLPIWGFYLIVPWLLDVLHGNLLLLLYLLARKLHLLNMAIRALPEPEQTEQYALLYPLPFNHHLVNPNYGRLMQWLLGFIVEISMAFFPLLLLVWAQIRFLPYHDPRVTWDQRLAVIFDIGLLWLLWPKIVLQQGEINEWWKIGWIVVKRRLRKVRSFVSKLFMRDHDSGPQPESSVPTGFISVLIISAFAVSFSFFVVVIPDSIEGHCGIFNVTCWLFDGPGALFHRNLVLEERTLIAEGSSPEVHAVLRRPEDHNHIEATKKVAGLRLANRDLRFANFEWAVLVNADLRGANLDGARLSNSVLTNADLGPVVNPKASGVGKSCVRDEQRFKETASPDAPEACRTSLHGAELTNAHLQDANLDYADLRDASLVRANLQHAELWRSNLQRANLNGAQLQASNLGQADLRGAELNGTTNLQGSNLSSASLFGVRGNAVTLLGAKMETHGVLFEGANLSFANLGGAVFAEAQLQGVSLYGANLAGAILADADLIGAELDRVRTGGADFTGSNLTLASVTEVDRTPLKEDEYRQAEERFRDDFLAHGDVATRLKKAIGQPDHFEKATATAMLCDNSLSFPNCYKAKVSKDYQNYTKKLVVFLASLACKNTHIAFGLARQIFDSRSVRLRNVSPLPAKTIDPLVETFLRADCPAVKALPETVKMKLKRLT